MSSTCVVGLQWGDEAKGKVVDLLGADHDYAVRYNGGANAGHTVIWGDRTFKLSLLPTGVLHDRLRSVIGNGVVVHPPKFHEEVEQLRAGGLAVGNLVVSDRAHVIFPYHMEEERLGAVSNASHIGTTGRGIGPCYQDKVGRLGGVRVCDLLKPDALRVRLESILDRKNRILRALDGPDARQFALAEVCDEYVQHGERLRPFVADTARELQLAAATGKRLLFEAAQGSLLDVDHGTYPYVTSSNSSPAGVWAGSGVPAKYLTRVIGVVKAYTTRVGQGPLPTELHDATGNRIREVGREYGTVTGRPRRVGWFDAVAARYSAELGGVDELALTLLDVLSGLPEVRLCTAYTLDGGHLDTLPADANDLARCVPVYETLPGWSEPIQAVRERSALPAAARRYIDRVEALVGRPATLVSVGPDRDQTIRG